MITFSWSYIGNNENVFLDGELIGTVKRVDGGWKYYPTEGDTDGEIFPVISECEDFVIKTNGSLKINL